MSASGQSQSRNHQKNCEDKTPWGHGQNLVAHLPGASPTLCIAFTADRDAALQNGAPLEKPEIRARGTPTRPIPKRDAERMGGLVSGPLFGNSASFGYSTFSQVRIPIVILPSTGLGCGFVVM
jgi:hypothetical protein